MTGAFLLFGLAIGAFTISGLFGDDDPEENPSSDIDPDEDTADVIVDDTFETVLTDAFGADGVSEISFEPGPLDIKTEGGDDVVAGGAGDDILDLGDGNDVALAGAGNDLVELGDGDDVYGVLGEGSPLSLLLGDTEVGDDTVFGQSGNDQIIDVFGSNTLSGGFGDDLLSAVDDDSEGAATPDRLEGNSGNDEFRVDDGDVVVTGGGADTVIAIADDSLGAPMVEGPVEITDFDASEDALQLAGITDPAQLRIEVFADGTGSTVLWDTTPLVRVIGGQDLTLADIFITPIN